MPKEAKRSCSFGQASIFKRFPDINELGSGGPRRAGSLNIGGNGGLKHYIGSLEAAFGRSKTRVLGTSAFHPFRPQPTHYGH